MAAELSVGQRLQIRPARTEEDWLPSRIEDLTDATVVVAAPIKAGVLLPAAQGTVMEVRYALNDAFYRFNAEVLERRTDSLPVLVLRQPAQIQRFQRRRLFRLPLILDVVYRKANEAARQKGMSLDISGGGLLLVTSSMIEPGAELELDVRLPGGDAVGVKGHVVESHLMEGQGPGPKRYASGVEFVDIPALTQERIVSFIFAQQRERRQRELGVR